MALDSTSSRLARDVKSRTPAHKVSQGQRSWKENSKFSSSSPAKIMFRHLVVDTDEISSPQCQSVPQDQDSNLEEFTNYIESKKLQKKSLRGKSEMFQTRREVMKWIREICVVENPVDSIFVSNEYNTHPQSSSSTESDEPSHEDNHDFEDGKIDLASLDFDAFRYSADMLAELCVEIFCHLRLDKELAISRDAFRRFVLNVRRQMVDNPYHNWFHVADVVQMVYALALHSGVLHQMPSGEIFALLVAALCHDLDHPGVNNAFLIKTQSALASQYAMDAACLEKHHSSCASELLSNQNRSGLLDCLDDEHKEKILERVQRIIMATDVSRHGEYEALLQSLISSNNNKWKFDGGSREMEMEHRHAIAELLIKCADMSNVLKPFPIAKKWAVRITDEFFHQGDLERSLGMEVTPTCDRHRQSRVALQQGFVAFVAPFYRAVGELLPGLRPLGDRLARTRDMWQGYACDRDLLAEEAPRQQQLKA